MSKKLICVSLLVCSFCRAQSTLTTPNPEQQPDPTPPARPTGQIVEPAKNDAEALPIAPRVVGPLTDRSDFELFAEEVAGHRLPVYGRQLFDEVPSTFAPLGRIPVPANYAIGPGDELLIRVWGKIELDSHATVDRNGQIFLPKVGALNVAGLRYEQLDGYLHSAIGALYRDFELNVTLGKLRSLQIYVLGSARQPGSYTVGALSTLVDALFACGGPSAIGTMRHIQLLRENRPLADFDIYDLLQNGDKSRDIPLLAGDVIYIPAIGAQAAIAGSVNRPGIYEISGETTIASALRQAGGLTSLAGTNRVVLERIEEHRQRKAEEFPLDASGLRRLLRDGDVLRIFPISPQFENAVTLRGSVAQPGRYVLRAGMRISDLIPSRTFLLTRDYWNRQNTLVPGDIEHPFGASRDAMGGNRNRSETADTSSASNLRRAGTERDDAAPSDSQSGRQHRPAGAPDDAQPGDRRNQTNGSASYASGERRGADRRSTAAEDKDRASGDSHPDLVAEIAGNNAEINWEYAVIERLDDRDLSTRLIAFHLGHAIDEPASSADQLLKAGDIVTIFSRRDIPLPVEKHATFVRVGGEINAPGVYRVDPGETLRNVVERAGGLTSHSYLYASQLLRVSTRRLQEAQLKRSVDQMQRDLLASNATRAPASLDGSSEQDGQSNMRQALISRLAEVEPTGRVVLDMNPASNSATEIPDLPLEDGDSFYIPPQLGTIQVTGSVYNENAFRYQARKPLSAYLNDAGGATREADVKRVFLIRADGTVVSRQSRDKLWHGSFANLKLLPGDAIVVPARLKTSGGFRAFEQMTQVLSQTALTAAALSAVTR